MAALVDRRRDPHATPTWPVGPRGSPAVFTSGACPQTAPVSSPPCSRTVSSSSRRPLPSCRARARFLPVNWHLKADELAWILEDSGAQVLVAHSSLREYVDAALARAPGCRALVVGDDYESAIETAEPVTDDGWLSPGVHLLHVGHDGPAEGRRARRTGGPTAMDDGAGRTRVHLGVPRRRRAPRSPGPRTTPARGGYAFTTLFTGGTVVIMPSWDARRALAADRAPPRHHDVPHACPLHPAPRGARRRAARHDLTSASGTSSTPARRARRR